jgi:hypothetical protein
VQKVIGGDEVGLLLVVVVVVFLGGDLGGLVAINSS